jgi:hypothetical protein
MATNFITQRRSKLKSRRKASPQQERVKQIDVNAVKQQHQRISLFIYMVRLAICCLGASAIAGTVMSVMNPPKQQLTTQVDARPQPKSPPISSHSSKPQSKIDLDLGLPHPILIQKK